MKSRLNYFYNKEEMLDKKNKLLIDNPYYMVNEYIKGFNMDNLNKNYLTNLGDLNICKKNNKRYLCFYDNNTNTLYSNSYMGDVLGLFHVSSNDREKQGYGVVDSKDNGIGLNSGITSLFTNIVTNEKLLYPIESLSAETLLLINDKILPYAYFNNDKDTLKIYHENIPVINRLLDKINKDFKMLSTCYRLTIPLELRSSNYIFRDKYKSKLNEIDEEAYHLYRELMTTIRALLNNLIIIVLESNIESSRKKEILSIINEDLNSIIESSKVIDLTKFNNYINDFSSKRKVLWKK